MIFLDTYQGVFDNFIRDILTEDIADAAFQGITLKMQTICGALVSMFFMIALAWEYAGLALKGKGWNFRWTEIGRLLLLWIAIGILPSLMALPAIIADYLRDETSQIASADNLKKYEEYIKLRGNFENEIKKGVDPANSYNRQNTQTDQQGNILAEENVDNTTIPEGSEAESYTPDAWDEILDYFNFENALSVIIGGIVYIVCQIIKLAIVAFCLSASKVMIVLAPLSVVFSMLPWSKEKLGEWFSFYIVLLFVPVTLNIMDAVTLHYIYKNMSSHGLQSNILGTTAMELTIVILYLYAFGITSKYIGSKEAGQAFNQGVRQIMEAVQTYTGAKGATSLAKMAKNGGGGLADNVSKTGMEALKK